MDIIKRKNRASLNVKTPRGMAIEILNRIESKNAFAEPLLDACLDGGSLPESRDRRLLTELVYGTLRMRGQLDWIIGQFHRRGPSAPLEIGVRNILRTALYQLTHTDRIPPFAAVNEAVNLAKKDYPTRAPLVNAVLRNFLRREHLPYPDPGQAPALYLSLLHSHPLWIVERWMAQLGTKETEALCEADNRTPPLTARVNTIKTTREAAIASLLQEGTETLPTPFSPDGLWIGKLETPLKSLHGVQNGLIRIQDEASQLIARLADPQPGEDVLDLCAGSGGKTTHLAAIMENRGRILAVDTSPDKLGVLNDAAARMGATMIETLAADAAHTPDKDLCGRFDLVMADVPCSGLGTVRRKPEIKWRIRPQDIRKAADLQGRILNSAAACVKPGGRLVYSTCSIMPEENEETIAAFLAEHREFIRLTAIKTPFMEGLIDPEGFFRTYPHRDNMDGFFGTILTRKF